MLQPAPGAGLVGQVALGHAHIAGAEQAIRRAGVGLGQHGDRGDAGQRAHRLHADARQQGRVLSPLAGLDQPAVGCHQGMLGQVAALRPGMPPHGLIHRPSPAHLLQHGTRHPQHLRRIYQRFLPLFPISHTKLHLSSEKAQHKEHKVHTKNTKHILLKPL